MPIFIDGVDNRDVDGGIRTGFELYGLHPKCQNCLNRGKDCEQGTYAAPGSFFFCVYWKEGKEKKK